MRIFCENFIKKIRRKSWSNVTPKLLAYISFLYKVVHKIGCLPKLNRAREIEFNFCTAWTVFMKPVRLVGMLMAVHVLHAKHMPQNFLFLTRDLVMVFCGRKNGVKSSLNLERSQLSPQAKVKKSEANVFFKTALLLLFCENRLHLS